MLETIFLPENNFNPKFLTMTGDYSSHNVWDISYDSILKSTTNVTNTIKNVLSANNNTET